MNLKSFIDSDRIRLRKTVTSFISNTPNLDILNIRYDGNYANKTWRAMVYFLKRPNPFDLNSIELNHSNEGEL